MIHAAADWLTLRSSPGGDLATAVGRAPGLHSLGEGWPRTSHKQGCFLLSHTSQFQANSSGRGAFTEEERGAHWPQRALPTRHSPRPPPHPPSHVSSGAPGSALNPLLSSPTAVGGALYKNVPHLDPSIQRDDRGQVTPNSTQCLRATAVALHKSQKTRFTGDDEGLPLVFPSAFNRTRHTPTFVSFYTCTHTTYKIRMSYWEIFPK